MKTTDNFHSNYFDIIVQADIFIDGNNLFDKVNFDLFINEKTNSHNYFQVKIHADSLEEKKSLPLKNTREFLGKSIKIILKQFNKESYCFQGFITGIVNDKFSNYDGNIIIKGEASSILLENGIDCKSFENKNLKNIVEKTIEKYKSDLNLNISTKHSDILSYTVQYKESDFQFINRLAIKYGEWFYYDGKNIVFGGNGGKEVEFIEDRDVEKFEFKMKTSPQRFKYMAYNLKTAKIEEVSSEEITHRSIHNPFVVKAIEASESIYTQTPNAMYNHSLLELGRTELKPVVERQKRSRANLFKVFIKSRNPNV